MRRRACYILLSCFLASAPSGSAHGALAINELETYAISDFEGHEDSLPWEGFEIWDVYVGDGYSQAIGSHGVYFKVNLAGDGTVRPTGGQSWDITFQYNVGNESFMRTISHDGSDVTTDFEELDWQIADGNVFQVRAWAPVAEWEGQTVSDLVLVSSVDGQPRDTAPGGIHDPVTGAEIPWEAPGTVVFPAQGEGRLVEEVPLTGPAKFLDITFAAAEPGMFEFNITNPLAEQGQHVAFAFGNSSGWMLGDAPNALSLDGGAATSVPLTLTLDEAAAVIEPLRFDVFSDIGGLQSFYAFMGPNGVQLVDEAAMAEATSFENAEQATPGVTGLALLGAIGIALTRRRG